MNQQEIRDPQFVQIAFNGSIRMLHYLNWSLPLLPFLILCENKNPPERLLVKCAFISDTVDCWGCGHQVHSRGVGMPGPCSEGLVLGCDGGDLQEPAVCGWGSLPCEVGIWFGGYLHVFPLCLLAAHVLLDWVHSLVDSDLKKLCDWHEVFKLVLSSGDLCTVWYTSFSTSWVFIKLISNFEILNSLFSTPLFLVQ